MKRFVVIAIYLAILVSSAPADAKKIRNNLKIERETKVKTEKQESIISGKEINLADTVEMTREIEAVRKALKACSFSGYDKEINSSHESFILVNPSEEVITGFEVTIDYLDLKGRMLHSRDLKEACEVPPGESRRIDVRSWDRQHAYYYYLGNEPRKVATPFMVKFRIKSLWIED